MKKTAAISVCGRFRYSLTRCWSDDSPTMCFIMLNPSKADAAIDDPTVRRCIRFARDRGYGGISVVNLFAFRATDPAELKASGWLVGPDNDVHILRAVFDASEVVCAWGANARGHPRVVQVRNLISLWCVPVALGLTDDGVPRHPLYLRADSVLTPLP